MNERDKEDIWLVTTILPFIEDLTDPEYRGLHVLHISYTEHTFAQVEIIYEWSSFKFDAPFQYPLLKHYIPRNTPLTGIEIGTDRIFLATGRMWSGSPATLWWIPKNNASVNEISPTLRAYPNWEWHWAGTMKAEYGLGIDSKEDCSINIISVFPVQLDKCDRLWVLDSGAVDVADKVKLICPPKILIFDSHTDQLVRIIEFPSEILRINSFLSNIIIDHNSENVDPIAHCDDIFIYVSEITNPAIIVYGFRKNNMWRISNPFMYPDPQFGTLQFAGDRLTLMDGIMGLALSPSTSSQKQLYFQPFASDKIFAISTSILQVQPKPGLENEVPVSIVAYKSSQAGPLAVDPRDGALIFYTVAESTVTAFNLELQDYQSLICDTGLLLSQFSFDIRMNERDREGIWLITTILPFVEDRGKNKYRTPFRSRIFRITRSPYRLYETNWAHH